MSSEKSNAEISQLALEALEKQQETLSVAKGSRKFSVNVRYDYSGNFTFPATPPHTRLIEPIATIYRGENFHGSLEEDLYILWGNEDAFESYGIVLWVGDTGSQDDFDVPYLRLCAWMDQSQVAYLAEVQDEKQEEHERSEITKVILYAYVRMLRKWWGHFDTYNEFDGPEDLEEVFQAAVREEPISES